jgi:large subunit ribosomal protein L30
VSSLRVTQVRSAIGAKPKQRGTLRALGLRRPHDTVELPDRPEIRGMVASIPHLVRVESGEAPAPAKPVETEAEAPAPAVAKKAPAKKAPAKKKAPAAKKTTKKAT